MNRLDCLKKHCKKAAVPFMYEPVNASLVFVCCPYTKRLLDVQASSIRLVRVISCTDCAFSLAYCYSRDGWCMRKLIASERCPAFFCINPSCFLPFAMPIIRFHYKNKSKLLSDDSNLLFSLLIPLEELHQ